VKPGDLVRIKLFPDNPELRVSGVIIEMGSSHSDCSNDIFPIARVMWNTGLEWIDATRLEVVNGKI
jgi:hypothetical protein